MYVTVSSLRKRVSYIQRVSTSFFGLGARGAGAGGLGGIEVETTNSLSSDGG